MHACVCADVNVAFCTHSRLVIDELRVGYTGTVDVRDQCAEGFAAARMGECVHTGVQVQVGTYRWPCSCLNGSVCICMHPAWGQDVSQVCA